MAKEARYIGPTELAFISRVQTAWQWVRFWFPIASTQRIDYIREHGLVHAVTRQNRDLSRARYLLEIHELRDTCLAVIPAFTSV